jgi:FtsX-like permease family
MGSPVLLRISAFLEEPGLVCEHDGLDSRPPRWPMIALRRRRELALLRLTGATTRQVQSMARWEAILIITIGLGIGLAITATALLPLSHALTGRFRQSGSGSRDECPMSLRHSGASTSAQRWP